MYTFGAFSQLLHRFSLFTSKYFTEIMLDRVGQKAGLVVVVGHGQDDIKIIKNKHTVKKYKYTQNWIFSFVPSMLLSRF